MAAHADVNGQMDWYTAVAWADGFSFAGYDDWRLPTADPACGMTYDCIGSEMGHLWYIELGNPAGGPMTNTGSFENLQQYYYWSGTEYAPDDAYLFYAPSGEQGVAGKFDAAYAMAVRNGDVAVVPEPQTVALLLAGLTAFGLARRQLPR